MLHELAKNSKHLILTDTIAHKSVEIFVICFIQIKNYEQLKELSGKIWIVFKKETISLECFLYLLVRANSVTFASNSTAFAFVVFFETLVCFLNLGNI